MDLETNLGKLKLKNPVILASGTFNRNITKQIDVNKLGAITTKTITLKPREGNPLPHIIKTEFGWLNSVGLKNVGLEKYLADELPFWQKFDTKIITSIGGETIPEYVKLAKNLNNNVDAIEVNVSCPNVNSGMAFGTDPKILKKLISDIRKVYKKTLIIKLSPNVTDITLVARAAIDGGADILTLINCFKGLAINPKTSKSYFDRKIGGYSGPAIKPMALKIVYEVYNQYKYRIIGGGGIYSTQDAIDFLRVGAYAIFIGSASFLDPKISIKIVKELEKYVSDNKIKNIKQIRGII